MYHALEISELLLKIFNHCPPYVLTALARTCHTFKEPALDALWEELDNLSPLARCLPEASHRLRSDGVNYSFHRPLTQIEWDILHGYTRRVRYLSLGESFCGLNPRSIRRLSRPPTSEPLFLNLRSLCIEYTDVTSSVLLLPLPSLLSLEIQLSSPRIYEDCLESFAKMSPNLWVLSIRNTSWTTIIGISEFDPSFICQWQNLRFVDCLYIFPDVNTLVHLSRIPALTRLSFALSSSLPQQIAPLDRPLTFSDLRDLTLRSESLTMVSKLFLHSRLPVVTRLGAVVHSRPSKQDVSSFVRTVQTSSNADAIHLLHLTQAFALDRVYFPDSVDPKPVLGFKDLQSTMTFSDLRRIDLDLEWKVSLTDAELLTLASAWPQLEVFFVNKDWGWGTRGGITPRGLLRFLGACPSLARVALAIDTRGYTRVAPPELDGARVGRLCGVDVLDSCIEPDAVPAVAEFLAGIIAPRADVCLRAWASRVMIMKFSHRVAHRYRWDDVCRRVRDAVGL